LYPHDIIFSTGVFLFGNMKVALLHPDPLIALKIGFTLEKIPAA
jgi:hypothetical protein